MKPIRENYNHTLYACYIGYVTQAIANNFVPLLFLTFQGSFHISLDKIAMLVSFNFGVQLLVDMAAAKYVDRIGYRRALVIAHACAAAGIAGLGLFPLIMDAYSGLLLAVCFYAVGGGLTEVLISPIVEACPTERKEGAMSLLHSFYCWGHVFVVICSTIFFTLFGIRNWKILACLWAIIPFLNMFYFMKVPVSHLVEEEDSMSIRQLLGNRMFWVLVLLMACAGASEQGMSQWASAFAESGLRVSKTVGDLAGPCAFAVCMGSARAFYGKYSDKISLHKFMAGSALLCIAGYLLAALSGNPVLGLAGCAVCGMSVGIMWPGTLSISAKSMRTGGTAMFAFLALAGDLGCSTGPAVVGMVSSAMGNDLRKGLLAALIFPALLLAGLAWNTRVQRRTENGNILTVLILVLLCGALPAGDAHAAEPQGGRQDGTGQEMEPAVNRVITVEEAGGFLVTVASSRRAEDGSWEEEFRVPGICGRNGCTYDKKEGDGKTPYGIYSFTMAFGLLENPGSILPYHQITPYDYWVDDPDSIYYNRLVDRRTAGKDWSSAEHMSSQGISYNYGLALDYNEGCVPGKGSAIFLHGYTEKNDSGSAGCIRIPEEQMKYLVQTVTEKTRIIIKEKQQPAAV